MAKVWWPSFDFQKTLIKSWIWGCAPIILAVLQRDGRQKEKNPPATCGPARLECLPQQKKQDFAWNRGRREPVSHKLSFNLYMHVVAQTNPWSYTHACAQNIHSFTKGFSQRSREHLKWKDLFTHSINPARQQWGQKMIPWILDLAEMKWSCNTPKNTVLAHILKIWNVWVTLC